MKSSLEVGSIPTSTSLCRIQVAEPSVLTTALLQRFANTALNPGKRMYGAAGYLIDIIPGTTALQIDVLVRLSV